MKRSKIAQQIQDTAAIQWIRSHQVVVIRILESWCLSRALLLVIAWFSPYFAGNPIYQKYLDQGYFLSPKWWIDIWCRWDSKWYLSIVQYGYTVPQDISSQYSNIAFFPLYPYLIKLFTFWFPDSLQTESVFLLTGLMISNICFILALFGLYELGKTLFGEESAKKAILLYLCIPAGFYFSAFYTESLFLFLIVFSLVFAEKNEWRAAGFFSMFAALTRPHGILILIPLGWIYLSKKNWKIRSIRSDICWLLLAPMGILVFFFGLYRLTGNFFVFFEAQGSWGRSIGVSFFSSYFEPLFNRFNRIAVIDTLMITLSFILSIVLLVKIPQKAYGIYALCATLILILTGNLFSMTRYTAAIFPIFLFSGSLLSNHKVFTAICGIFIVLQILYFSGWINYYWIA